MKHSLVFFKSVSVFFCSTLESRQLALTRTASLEPFKQTCIEKCEMMKG